MVITSQKMVITRFLNMQTASTSVNNLPFLVMQS